MTSNTSISESGEKRFHIPRPGWIVLCLLLAAFLLHLYGHALGRNDPDFVTLPELLDTVNVNWQKHRVFYGGAAADILSGLEAVNGTDGDVFSFLEDRFQSLSRSASSEDLLPPSGIRIIDEDGTIPVWAGGGFEPFDTLPGLTPESDSGQGSVSLPAGTEMVFWDRDSSGLICVIQLPISRRTLPPFTVDDRTYQSYLESRYPLSLDLTDAPSFDPSQQIILDEFIGLRVQLRRGVISDGGSGMGMNGISRLLVFVAVLTAAVMFWRRIPARYSVWRAAAGLTGSVVLFVLGIQMDLPNLCLPDVIMDPKVYAGPSVYFALPGQLIFAGFALWIGSAACRWTAISRVWIYIFRLISPLILFIPPLLGSHILDQITGNSSLKWWPRVMLPSNPAVVLLPATAILATAASVRVVLWMWGWAWCNNRKSASRYGSAVTAVLFGMILGVSFLFPGPEWIRPFYATGFLIPVICLFTVPRSIRSLGSRVPATWSLLAALLILVPMITPRAHRASLSAVQERLSGWIEEKDALRMFALESNLMHLRRNPGLIEAVESGDFRNGSTVYDLWERSDLSAVSSQYGVEIWSTDGRLLDRFAPGLDFEALPATFLNRLREVSDRPLLVPWTTRRGLLQKDLTGGVAVLSSGSVTGFLIIRLPAGSLAALPPVPEWGHQARLHLAWGGQSPMIPPGIPPLPDSDILNDPPADPDWVVDDQNNRSILVLRYREMESGKIPLLLADLPSPGLAAETAGYLRLGFLALIILIPGLVVWLFERSRRGNTASDRLFSYRNQLMIAFTVFAIVIPGVFALILRGIVDDAALERQYQRIQLLSERAHESFISRCIDAAYQVESQLVEGRLDSDNELTEIRWTALNSQGHSLQTSELPPLFDLPLEMIADTFHSHSPGCSFCVSDDGDLYAQTVLPYTAVIDGKSVPGTIIVEVPVTLDQIHDLTGIPDIPVDLYTRGRICNSTRPDLFNAGFLPFRLDPDVFLDLQATASAMLIRQNRQNGLFFSHTILRNSHGEPSGYLSIQFTSFAESGSGETAYDLIWLIISGFWFTGLLIAVVMGNRLASPIRELTKGAARVSRGELSIPVSVTSGGDLSEFGDTFNRMMTDLELQRRDLENRHRFIAILLESMHSGLVALDEQDRISVTNSAFRHLFNLEESKLEGRFMHDLFTELHLGELTESINTLRQHGGSREVTVRSLREGRIVHFRCSMTILTGNNSVHEGLLLVFDDISDAVRSSKMEAYAEMARRVAHEIKNPLTPIQLSIEHLRQTYSDKAPDFDSIFTQCTATILEEVRSLRTIALEFSQFARLPQPVRKPESIASIMDEVMSIFSSPPDGIRIRQDVKPELPFCLCDREQIKRVLINLVQNSIQAMPDGGMVTISGSLDHGMICLDVRDTGAGMDQETMLRLFEPYFSTRKDGIGLGLVIAKSTIDEHDGEIRVRSHPGEGTCFTIRLPVFKPNIDHTETKPDDTGKES
jgi:PAS domain S-box-containing protein